MNYYHEGFAAVKLNNDEWAFVDKNGNLQKGRYVYARDYHNGFAAVRVSLIEWTFIDKNGKRQWNTCSKVRDYEEGFAAVELMKNYTDEERKWAYVDENGNLLDGRYNCAFSFKKGFAKVSLSAYNNLVEIDKSENIYMDKDKWPYWLEKEPEMYKFIPPSYLKDKEFLNKVSTLLKYKLIQEVNKVEFHASYDRMSDLQGQFKYCKKIMDIIDKKNEEAGVVADGDDKDVLKQRKEFEKSKKEMIEEIEEEFGE